MEADYKAYARDLYNMKLAAIGSKPADKSVSELRIFLSNINDLRPKLRLELSELAKEFMTMMPNLPTDYLNQIQEVNQVYIKKLQAFANRVRREIRRMKR